MTKYLIQVKVLPTANVRDIITRSWEAISEGIKETNARVIIGFRVLGENCLIAVSEGSVEDIQKATDHLNASSGETIEVTCTPLRNYHEFAKNVLGVDETLCNPGPETLVDDGNQIFWMQSDIEYKGLSQEELLSIWNKEATLALTSMAESKLSASIQIYKTVAIRQVHAFLSLPDGGALDDIMFQVPLMKLMGDNVKITLKSVIILK